MSNSFGIPAVAEKKIRERDEKCVYCGKVFQVYPKGIANDRAEIEHLIHVKPFHWNIKILPFDLMKDLSVVAICCGECNRSRSNKLHSNWFKADYCMNRDKAINEMTVEKPVREFIRAKKYLRRVTINQLSEPLKQIIEKSKWTFAKTMSEIPHFYIVRDNLHKNDKKMFDKFEWFIKRNGYVEEFYSKQYSYFNIDNYKYWIVGNILNRAIVEDRND